MMIAFLFLGLALAFALNGGDASAAPIDDTPPTDGTDGDDQIDGSANGDLLNGHDGNDTILGGAGHDTIDGGDGNDSLDAGAGNDSVLGGAGDDTIGGHGGNDTLLGQAGNDVIYGGPGDDSIDGGTGNDLLDGGTGINTVLGGEGNDTVMLNAGFEDRSYVDANGHYVRDQSSLSGGAGSDLLDASDAGVSLHLELTGSTSGVLEHIAALPAYKAVRIDGFERYATGSGNDYLVFQDTGVDQLSVSSGAGDDTLFVLGTGQHRIDTGAGNDDVTVDGNAGTQVQGGAGDDTLTVNLVRDAVITLDENGAGSVDQGAGPMTFANFEHIRFAGVNSHHLVDASAITHGSDIWADSVIGGIGDDSLAGNWVSGGAGDDVLFGTVYGDGGDGDDFVNAETAIGGAGNDTVAGDIADGGAGDDIVHGLTSARGGDGNDEVDSRDGIADGGAGDDTLSGETMTGGTGLDSFVSLQDLRNGTAIGTSDVITDYEPGESVSVVVSYNNTDLYDRTVAVPEPTVTVESDPLANAVRVLVNGDTVLTVQGTSSIPGNLLEITTQGYNPWDDPNYSP